MTRRILTLIGRSHLWLRTRSPYDDLGAGPAETAAIIAGLVVAALALVAAVQAFTGNQISVLDG